jgi:hypothetical protein
MVDIVSTRKTTMNVYVWMDLVVKTVMMKSVNVFQTLVTETLFVLIRYVLPVSVRQICISSIFLFSWRKISRFCHLLLSCWDSSVFTKYGKWKYLISYHFTKRLIAKIIKIIKKIIKEDYY